MKFFKTLTIFFFMIVITSCSSDDSSNDSSNDSISGEDSFEYKFEGEDINITRWNVSKSESTIAVVAYGENEEFFQILFNIHGDLGSVSISTGEEDEDGFDESYYSYEYFKSKYFNFHLLGIDEANKRVSVRFSGNLFEDAYVMDEDAEEPFIEGSFNVEYNEVTPSVSGLGVSANIDGDMWYATSSTTSGSDQILTKNHYSDDEYIISYVVDPYAYNTGRYEFNESSQINKITVFKYNSDLDLYEEYTTSGIFQIDEHEEGAVRYIKGSFSLTAVKGNETIEMTDGYIYDIYTY